MIEIATKFFFLQPSQASHNMWLFQYTSATLLLLIVICQHHPTLSNQGQQHQIPRIYAHHGYPFTHDDLNYRQESLLNSLRDHMRLTVYEDTLPMEVLEPMLGEMRLRNTEGQLFAASLMQPKAKAVFVPRPQPELTDAKLLSKMLKGFCGVLPNEYWMIEWCHRVEVRQFHVQIVEDQAMRSPDYSLGTYERSAIIRERGDLQNKSARIVKMVEYFSGGQYCDETQGYRSTEVHIQCCEGLNINNVAVPPVTQVGMGLNMGSPFPPGHAADHHLNPMNGEHDDIPGQKEHMGSSAGPVAILKASAEPRVCSYQLVVCSHLLCPDKPPPDNDDILGGGGEGGDVHRTGGRPPSGNMTLAQVMTTVQSLCLFKAEEWWTYELCFNKGIRQFHVNVQMITDENGEVKSYEQTMETEYSLGKPPPIDRMLDENYLQERAWEGSGELDKKRMQGGGRSDRLVDKRVATSSTEAQGGGGHVQSVEKRSESGTQTQEDQGYPSSRTGTKVNQIEVGSSGLDVRAMGLPPPELLGRGKGKDGGVKTLKLEFTEGTPCDIVTGNGKSLSYHHRLFQSLPPPLPHTQTDTPCLNPFLWMIFF